MSTPRVSVIMLTYNRPQLISRAIQSIVDQDFPDWELVLVHDGPNQETEGIVAGWIEREPRLRYLRRKQGGNIANATNCGIGNARGEYIAILDDDDYWTRPDKLRMQVDFLDANPQYAGCGGGVIVIDEQGRERLRYLKPERDEDVRKNALFANPMAHSTVMYRRSALDSFHGYDESLPGFQDWDVCLKLTERGKLYNFPLHLAFYQLWDRGGSFQDTKPNTTSAIRIVKRHGNRHRGFPVALAMAYLYHLYAHMPVGVKKVSYYFLSGLKKTFFSGTPRQSH